MGKPLKVRLRPTDGFELQKLDCELIWATAWEEGHFEILKEWRDDVSQRTDRDLE